MSGLCEWLHEQLETLPLVRWPFNLAKLPNNGIYFFYEAGEVWGHGGSAARIVRVGTHRDGNFRARIAEHFLIDERKMNFDARKPAPHDRSIFRKNLGRALLSRDTDAYAGVWEIDFMKRANREPFAHLRDIPKEKQIESAVTRLLRETFSFRFVELNEQIRRIGRQGLEGPIIGTLAQCGACAPSVGWLGRHSPVADIKRSGLWLVHHLKDRPLDDLAKRELAEAISRTRELLDRMADPQCPRTGA